jgi:hypothetical protein
MAIFLQRKRNIGRFLNWEEIVVCELSIDFRGYQQGSRDT